MLKLEVKEDTKQCWKKNSPWKIQKLFPFPVQYLILDHSTRGENVQDFV